MVWGNRNIILVLSSPFFHVNCRRVDAIGVRIIWFDHWQLLDIFIVIWELIGEILLGNSWHYRGFWSTPTGNILHSIDLAQVFIEGARFQPDVALMGAAPHSSCGDELIDQFLTFFGLGLEAFESGLERGCLLLSVTPIFLWFVQQESILGTILPIVTIWGFWCVWVIATRRRDVVHSWSLHWAVWLPVEELVVTGRWGLFGDISLVVDGCLLGRS